MASIKIRVWERLITDVRLVPKLVLLMVFSTIMIVGKQLWDASTFYHSVTSVQKEQALDIAESEAAIFDRLFSSSIDADTIVQAFQASKSKSSTNFTYLVNLDSGAIVGHPAASNLNSFTMTTDQGKSLKGELTGLTGSANFELNDGQEFIHATKLKNANWVMVASQSADVAQKHYDAYLVQMSWQTVILIVVFVCVLLGAASVMLRQINYIADAIKNLAAKNLATPIELNCKDEYGDLARELEKSRIQLQDVIKTQIDSSQELSGLTEIMTISMSETKESAEEEFADIDRIATAMGEMRNTVQTVADNANSASDLSKGASEQAQTGQRFVQNSIAKMKELSQYISESAEVVNQVENRVDSISSVVGTIQGISEQTNLLALNAAIEAARAGEAGRGFAVVADEVRNLAQSTQTATVEIQDMITQLQDSANSAVELMEKSVVEAADGAEMVTNAGEELNGIVEQVSNINDMNFQIASAADQQRNSTEDMDKNLSNVRELVEASVLVVTELLETSEIMQTNAEELDEKLKLFEI